VYPARWRSCCAPTPVSPTAAIVGAPSPKWGETVVAFVVPAPSAPASLVADLEAYCEANLVAYKRPREWHLVESIPRNALGKVLRHQLRVG
jgi:acyl-CoA synthetase (AMP-forming)/AMP-acid ligase II